MQLVTMVMLSVSDLGFSEGALTREIIGSEGDRDLFGNLAPFTCGGCRQLGLELCQPEAGLQYRLKYRDQPAGEHLYVAMMPISSPAGEPQIFVLAHGVDGLALNAARARPDDRWDPDDKFLFSLRS